ncbi:MAG: A/G-specific adenine glycosylase [Candidatus Latescibacterota bacterium]
MSAAPWPEGREAVDDFRRCLLAWYRRHRRPLRWRDSDDPYHIWVCEVMLQQTRVQQMGEHYERFLARFPTVQALAAAGEDEVLKAWEGLGYYSRARNLHRAARRVVTEHQGRLPDTYQGLLDLPGIGRYTAAAVSSIAFDRDHPVLDGNVTRLLCRLLREDQDPRLGAVRTRLVAAAERLLPPGAAGDFNQAMMELGARVCTPRRPQCPHCPVSRHCRARHELEDPAALPVRLHRPPRPHYQVAAGVIWRGDRLLVAQRPPQGMLGGMWEFPGGKQEPGETLQECLVREIGEELGIQIEVGRHLVSVDHAYTHFRITLHAFAARCPPGEPQAIGCADWRWITPGQLDELALPRADRRIAEHLRSAGALRGGLSERGGTGDGDDGA